MSIKNEVERIKRERKKREAEINSQLIKELDSVITRRKPELKAAIEPYLEALRASGCVALFEDLRKSYNLTEAEYDDETLLSRIFERREPAKITVEINDSSGHVTCDPKTFELSLNFDKTRSEWLSKISRDLHSLAQDKDELQIVRDNIHNFLSDPSVANVRVTLAWDRDTIYDGESSTTYVKMIVAEISCDNSEWQLKITSDHSPSHYYLKEKAIIPLAEWKGDRIRQVIANSFIALQRR